MLQCVELYTVFTNLYNHIFKNVGLLKVTLGALHPETQKAFIKNTYVLFIIKRN